MIQAISVGQRAINKHARILVIKVKGQGQILTRVNEDARHLQGRKAACHLWRQGGPKLNFLHRLWFGLQAQH